MALFDWRTGLKNEVQKKKSAGLFPSQTDYPGTVKTPGTNAIIANDMASNGYDMNEFADSNAPEDYATGGGDGPLPNEMPQRRGLFNKENIASTLLGVGLPAAFSLASGEGLIPGAMAGLSSTALGAEDQYQSDLDKYQKGKDYDLDRAYKSSMAGLSTGTVAEKERHNKMVEDIARKKLNQPKPFTNEETTRYVDLANKFSGDPNSLTDVEIDLLGKYRNRLR